MVCTICTAVQSGSCCWGNYVLICSGIKFLNSPLRQMPEMFVCHLVARKSRIGMVNGMEWNVAGGVWGGAPRRLRWIWIWVGNPQGISQFGCVFLLSASLLLYADYICVSPSLSLSLSECVCVWLCLYFNACKATRGRCRRICKSEAS